jgi:plastocyanin
MTNNPRAHSRRLAMLAVACIAIAGCTSDQTTSPEGTPPPGQVWVQDNRYVPASITINGGEKVTFVWQGANPHSVTFDDPNISSIPPRLDGEVEVAFPPGGGTYTYYCSIHGRAVMSGEVIVQPANPTGGPGS